MLVARALSVYSRGIASKLMHVAIVLHELLLLAVKRQRIAN